jgi:hypothetical protein
MPESTVDITELTEPDKAYLLGWMRRACPGEWAVAMAELEKTNARIAARMAERAAVMA